MSSAFYVLARGGDRIARRIPRNRGGDQATTMPPPWRAVYAGGELDSIDAMMSIWQEWAEVSVVNAGALTAEQIARYDRELAAAGQVTLPGIGEQTAHALLASRRTP